MIDSDELLSKADALLARWRLGAAMPRPPVDYPVLTEVVRFQAADRNAPKRELAVIPDSPVPNPADERLHPRRLEEPTLPLDATTQALEERVRLRVLEAIEPVVRGFLDESLRLRIDELARRLETTVARDARSDILALVSDAVRSAVARELEAPRKR